MGFDVHPEELSRDFADRQSCWGHAAAMIVLPQNGFGQALYRTCGL